MDGLATRKFSVKKANAAGRGTRRTIALKGA